MFRSPARLAVALAAWSVGMAFGCNALVGRGNGAGANEEDAASGDAHANEAEASEASSPTPSDAGTGSEDANTAEASPLPLEDASVEGGVSVFASIPAGTLVTDMASDGAELFWGAVDSCGSTKHFVIRAKSIGAPHSAAGRVLVDLPSSGRACGLGNCYRIALAGTRVFVANSADADGSVRSFAKDGTPDPIVRSNETTPCTLAMLDGRPYWSLPFTPNVRTVDALGNPRDVLSNVQVSEMESSASNLFYVGYDYARSEQVLVRAALPTAGVELDRATLWHATPTRTEGLSLSPTHVFWSRTSEGAIYMLPHTGGTPVLVASALGLPKHLRYAAPYLYFVSLGPNVRGDGVVGRIRIGATAPAGPVEPLAVDLELPQGLAVDDAHVYWFDSSVQAILRVRR